MTPGKGPRNEPTTLRGSEGPLGPLLGVTNLAFFFFQKSSKNGAPKMTPKSLLDPPGGGPWRDPKKFGRGQKTKKGAKEA